MDKNKRNDENGNKKLRTESAFATFHFLSLSILLEILQFNELIDRCVCFFAATNKRIQKRNQYICKELKNLRKHT